MNFTTFLDNAAIAFVHSADKYASRYRSATSNSLNVRKSLFFPPAPDNRTLTEEPTCQTKHFNN
ncbi:MAG: hypothetical protein LBQ31_05385 [Bacteroidales bacterium]|nr:hypothetical protein [Bacteroidales bacterium]